MTFFYDLNKRLASIATTQQLAESAPSKMQVKQPREEISEKWDEPTKVAPSEKGKYKGKTKAELKKQYDRLKASGPHKKGSPEFGKMRELAFAIRAKSDWGKVDEAPNEGNEFSGELAKAKATGAKEFEVDGKTYPVKESQIEEGYVDFMDKKAQYRGIGAEVEGRSDDYVVTFRDGSRRRYQELDGRRRVTTLEPVDAPEAQDDEGNVVKRGRGRPKGTGRSIGTRGVTDVRAKKKKVAEATGNLSSIVRANQRDVDAFMRSGDLSDSLYNVLFDYYFDEMPYGTAKARTGDPYEWISDRFYADMGGGIKEDYDKDEYDEEGEMAMSQARTIEDAAEELQSILDADENLPEWVQKKISLAKEYIDSARDYLKANRPDQEMDVEVVGEKAVSKAQRAAAGIAHAAKKGEIPKSELRGASKEMAKMPAGELRKFAKTKEKGLPEKVKEEDTETRDERAEKAGRKVAKDIEYDEKVKDKIHGTKRDSEDSKAEKAGRRVTKDIEHDEKVDETTTSGSVAATTAEPAAKSKGGMTFGKGIYDSMNRELEDMIAESMSINMSDSTEGGRSLTVTASDDDAIKLAAILKMAGLNSMRSEPESEGGCGTMEEAYGDVDATENRPDYPTNTEVSDDALQYSGGLNRPKSTGQTTVPVIASQLDRQVSEEAEEIDEVARMREMAGIGEAAKPDFPDIDDDGDRKESIAKAAIDREEKVDEAVEGSLWALYKRIA